jgi:HK97 family phage prohead protease
MTAADIAVFLAANLDADCELVFVAGPPSVPVITGYAGVFYKPGHVSAVGVTDDGFQLRVMPSAFDGELGKSRVVSMLDHRADQVLGSEAAGSLVLKTDDRGLRFWLRPPDTPFGWKLVHDVSDGTLTGASYLYRATRTREYRAADGRRVRELWGATLIEVGPVHHPRFPGGCCWMWQDDPVADNRARLRALADNLDNDEDE